MVQQDIPRKNAALMPQWPQVLLLVGSPVTHFFCSLAARSGHLHAVLGMIGHWTAYFGDDSRAVRTWPPPFCRGPLWG